MVWIQKRKKSQTKKDTKWLDYIVVTGWGGKGKGEEDRKKGGDNHQRTF